MRIREFGEHEMGPVGCKAQIINVEAAQITHGLARVLGIHLADFDTRGERDASPVRAPIRTPARIAIPPVRPPGRAHQPPDKTTNDDVQSAEAYAPGEDPIAVYTYVHIDGYRLRLGPLYAQVHQSVDQSPWSDNESAGDQVQQYRQNPAYDTR
jgi:hypothetical protein